MLFQRGCDRIAGGWGSWNPENGDIGRRKVDSWRHWKDNKEDRRETEKEEFCEGGLVREEFCEVRLQGTK